MFFFFPEWLVEWTWPLVSSNEFAQEYLSVVFRFLLYHPRGKQSSVEKIVFRGKCQQACGAANKRSELCYVEVAFSPI